MRRREERRRGEEGKREIYLGIKLMIIQAPSLNLPGIMISFPYLVLQVMESWLAAWDQGFPLVVKNKQL